MDSMLSPFYQNSSNGRLYGQGLLKVNVKVKIDVDVDHSLEGWTGWWQKGKDDTENTIRSHLLKKLSQEWIYFWYYLKDNLLKPHNTDVNLQLKG